MVAQDQEASHWTTEYLPLGPPASMWCRVRWKGGGNLRTPAGLGLRMDEQLIGRVTHYFPQIEVAAIAVEHGELRMDDTIRVIGHTSNFTQKIHSMEMDYAPVTVAGPGDLVAVQVAERARVNDQIYRIRAHEPLEV